MKKIICCVVLFSVLGSFETNAQFKLKKLNDVIVSMEAGESLENYTDYLTKYFERFDILEGLSNGKEFQIVKQGNQTFLQGKGQAQEGYMMVFRTEVTSSEDGLTITNADTPFKVQKCGSAGCTDCAFTDDGNCGCPSKGECEWGISM